MTFVIIEGTLSALRTGYICHGSGIGSEVMKEQGRKCAGVTLFILSKNSANPAPRATPHRSRRSVHDLLFRLRQHQYPACNSVSSCLMEIPALQQNIFNMFIPIPEQVAGNSAEVQAICPPQHYCSSHLTICMETIFSHGGNSFEVNFKRMLPIFIRERKSRGIRASRAFG